MTITAESSVRGWETRRNEGREIDDCPAERHRHSVRGWYADGCRCPSTAKAHDRKLEAIRQHHRENRSQYKQKRDAERAAARAAVAAIPEHIRNREIDTCSAPRHRHSREGYQLDGCRCPSTVARWEAWLDISRRSSRAYRARRTEARRRNPDIADFQINAADRRDAAALAMGYRVVGRVSKHTRGLAIRMMLDHAPTLTTGQIAWRLEAGGQGPVSQRLVQRIINALQIKQDQRGLPRYNRAGLSGGKG